MFSKLSINLWILIYFYAIQSNCQQFKSGNTLLANSLNISKLISKQWSQWPSGQWDGSQWPQTQWNSSQWPSSQWNSSQWPNNQWPPNQWNSTLKPWPPAILPVGPMPSTVEPIGPKPSTVQPITPKPTVNPWWPPTNQNLSSHQPSISQWHSTGVWPVSQWPSTPTLTTEELQTVSPTTTTRPSTMRMPTTTTTTTRPTTVWQPSPSPPTKPSTVANNDTFSLTVKSCGLSHIPQVFIGNKIVSGKVAKGGEFPWQVILKIHTARGPMQCGGAILNSRWILTAAHCVSNERTGTPTAQRIDVTAGIHNRLVVSAGSQQRTADCVIQHESWTGQYGKFKHDIALIRLPVDNPFNINFEKGGHINGICLPDLSLTEFRGKGRIAGWGLTKDKGSPSDILMYTDVTILSNEKCRTYPYPVPIADTMMCQGVDRTAPCQGDSGGPLIISVGDKRGILRMTEIGIVSFGPGECANAKTPNAIYTKVSHYLKWIEKTVKANSHHKCIARSLHNETTDKIEDKTTNLLILN